MASVQEMKDELQVLIDRANELCHPALDGAVEIAAQTGRLDFASLLLAIVGILLALGGVVGFIEVRTRVKTVAERTAREECREIAEKIVLQYINDELPDEIRKHVETLMPDPGDGEKYGREEAEDQS